MTDLLARQEVKCEYCEHGIEGVCTCAREEDKKEDMPVIRACAPHGWFVAMSVKQGTISKESYIEHKKECGECRNYADNLRYERGMPTQ